MDVYSREWRELGPTADIWLYTSGALRRLEGKERSGGKPAVPHVTLFGSHYA
jgi:hypothetical protein